MKPQRDLRNLKKAAMEMENNSSMRMLGHFLSLPVGYPTTDPTPLGEPKKRVQKRPPMAEGPNLAQKRSRDLAKATF